MKRTAFDERQDRQIADSYLADHFACRWCNAMTHRNELATYGARCRACWDAYLAERNPPWWPNRPLQPHERAAVIRRAKKATAAASGPRDRLAWAKALQAREHAGDPLSLVQRQAWRKALRHHDAPEPQEVPA